MEKKKKWTHSAVALLKDFVGEKFQGTTVDPRLSRQVALDGMVGFPAVSGSRVKDHLPLDGSGLRVPGINTKLSAL